MEHGLLETLINAGLTEKEAHAYLTLLQIGEATARQVATNASLKRPTTYMILDELTAKGLVLRRKDGGVEHFRAVSPHRLVERQSRVLDRLTDSLPDLLNLNLSYLASPVVSVHCGPAGVREVWEDSLKASSDILYWADANLSEIDYLDEDAKRRQPEQISLDVEFVEERVRRGVWVRGIIPYEKDTALLHRMGLEGKQKVFLDLRKEGERKLRDFRFVPRGEYMMQKEVSIYDDKVAILSYLDMLGIVIRSPIVADTARTMYKAAFDHARAQEQVTLRPEDLAYISSEVQ